MQSLGAVTYDDLKCPVQELLYKLEVYDGATWWDLCNLHEALIDGGLENWVSATNLTSWVETTVGTSTVNRAGPYDPGWDAGTFEIPSPIGDDAGTFAAPLPGDDDGGSFAVEEVRGGIYSARLDIDADNDMAAIQQADVRLRLPLNYRLSFRYKTGAGKTAKFELESAGVADVYLKSDGTWTTDVTFINLAAATSWTYYSIIFTPHAAHTLYNLVLTRDSAASGSIWFDDVSISAWPANYLVQDSLSFELGGAGVMPEPIAATWSAEIHNEDSVFHPRHPTSEFSELLRVGRQVRVSVGAKYNDIDYYFQRLIGFMDAPQFDNEKRTISISGGDYMKLLTDTMLRSPGNAWGSSATFSTTSPTAGVEIYDEADALEIGAGEANNVNNWTDDANCTVSSTEDTGGGSSYVMKIVKDTDLVGWATNANVGSVTSGKTYEISFRATVESEEDGSVEAYIYEADGSPLLVATSEHSDHFWGTISEKFTAPATSDVMLKFRVDGLTGAEIRVDEVSIKETGFGSEIYDEADALEIGADEANNITNWADDANCTASVVADEGGGSAYVMQIILDAGLSGAVNNTNVGAVTAGTDYQCSFKCIKTAGNGVLGASIIESGGYRIIGYVWASEPESWVIRSFRFTAPISANMKFHFFIVGDVGTTFKVDQISIRSMIGEEFDYLYELPDESNGIYSATLDGVPIFAGDPPEKLGWTNIEGSYVFEFVDGAVVTAGTDNLVVYFYTDQAPENVVADLLAAGPGDTGGGAGLYANRAAALAAMTYTPTGIILKKVSWFDTRTSILTAVTKLCERCAYRFWFDELGAPHFEPAPTHKDPTYWLWPGMFKDSGEFQDLGEVRNRISLEGIERAFYKVSGKMENSRFKSIASDATSIAAYREHTYSSTNDLFQDQTSLEAAAAALLAEYKNPKWYSDLRVPKNAAPIQRGDSIEWDVELVASSGTTPALVNTVRGIVRDASFSGDGFNYKCEMRSTAMNVANYTTATVTVTVEHCRGWTLTNAGAAADVQFNLPAATVGMEITFHVKAAQTLTVNPNGTERIAVLTGTNGDYLRSDAAIGSYLRLVCLAAGVWSKADISGTWTEE